MKLNAKKIALAAIVAVGMISNISCKKVEEEVNPGQIGKEFVNQIKLDSSTEQLLNNLFSIENLNIINYQSDTVYVINTPEQLSQLGGDEIIPDIDLKSNSIVWGYVFTPHTNCNVSSKELLFNGRSYTMNVNILKGAEGYDAITEVFFWGVYPKIEGQITLNVSYINE